MAPIESPIEPAARTGWVRVAVASGATAAGLAALLAGAAFGLQAVALPRPSNGQLIAAKTARWLAGQHSVESVARVRGRRVSSVCVNAVIGQLGGNLYGQKGSLLITGRLRLVETRFASFRLGTTFREEDGPLPAIRAVLAGCPRALERRIGRLLDNRVPIAVKRIFVRGTPMIRLSFQKPRNLVLLVDPRTFAPAEVRIARERTGWSHLAPGEPRDLARPGLRLSRRLRLFVKEDA